MDSIDATFKVCPIIITSCIDSGSRNPLKEAVVVPYHTAMESEKAIEIAKMVAELGNPNSITDVGVGAQIAFVGVIGGIYNVLINLKEIKDEEFKSKMKKDCANLKLKAERELKEITEIVEEKLS